MEKNEKELQDLLLKQRKERSTRALRSAILVVFLLCFVPFSNSFFLHFQSIKQFINKKAIFCFFNAILIFLVKDSTFLAASGEQPSADSGVNLRASRHHPPPPSETAAPSVEANLVEEEGPEEKNFEPLEVAPAPMVNEVEGDHGGEVVGEIEEIDIGELNRKFDEFIEKVKREREMEALQLILAR
ncbi:hypothetical protein AXF42_Ash013462 [Apostasia shenzhenica]|uniref:Uncharacterized protein n=1 Tax=Apostasia shenzhenica TaxID=1088818 RepID=A0A2I0A4C8_9ASPA|nr:hypothetical protein AXF42_Ash013462 [Apostasia shenzhenica]